MSWKNGISCLCFLCLCSMGLFAKAGASTYNKLQKERMDTVKVDLLDTLQKVSPGERAKVFSSIYREKLWPLDSAAVMTELERLSAASALSGDRELQVTLLTIKGLYYQQRIENGLPQAVKILKQALDKANTFKKDTLKAQITHFIGYTFYMMEEYPQAFEYMLEADKVIKRIGYENMPGIHKFNLRLAWALFSFEDYDQATYYIDLVLENAGTELEMKSVAYSLQGSVALEKKDLTQALSSYKKALNLARELEDSLLIGVYSIHIGEVLEEKNKPELARVYYREAQRLCMKYKDYSNAGGAILRQAKIESRLGNFDQAIQKIRTYDSLPPQYNPNNKYELIADYHNVLAHYHTEVRNFEMAKAHQDSFILYMDTVRKVKDDKLLLNLKVKAVTERYLADLAAMKKEESRQRLIRNMTWVIASLIVLLSGGMIYILLIRYKRQKEKQKILEIERERAREQLQNYRERLKFFIDDIREKNKFIEQLQEDDDIVAGGYTSTVRKNNVREQLYQSIILTEDDWISFKQLFDHVYPGFIKYLELHYPDFTNAETRFLMLLRLKLSEQEMANMLGISRRSVSRTSQRLRKKLGFSNSEELMQLAGSIQTGNH